MIIRQRFISRSDLRANPSVLYVFGDNTVRRGYGGQAKEMRGEPNAFGIATLVAPGTPFRDNIYARRNIAADLGRVHQADVYGTYIATVWPSDGVGTGLARMPPMLLQWMDKLIYATFGIENALCS